MPDREMMIKGAEAILDGLADRIGDWRENPEMGNSQGNGARNTAARFIDAILEMTEGYEDDLGFNMTTFPTKYGGMVVRVNLPIACLCSHHILPWHGTVDLAYIPDKSKLGVSKFPRYIWRRGHKLSSQEESTEELINGLHAAMEPLGIYVLMKAVHTCEGCRGARITNSPTGTARMLGVFEGAESYAARDEALRIMEWLRE